MGEKRLYFIQDSRSFTGNSIMWWRPNGQGYTSDIDAAWKVDEERAKQICRCRETDKMWPCDEIEPLAQRHVDFQRLREIGASR